MNLGFDLNLSCMNFQPALHPYLQHKIFADSLQSHALAGLKHSHAAFSLMITASEPDPSDHPHTDSPRRQIML